MAWLWKRKGKGRTDYEAKRQQVLSSQSHLVEIDFLRGDLPMAMQGVTMTTDYRLLVSRADCRPIADLYGFSLRELIPELPLPLKGDEIVMIDLQSITTGIYERSGYSIRIDYRQPLSSPDLSASDRQ